MTGRTDPTGSFSDHHLVVLVEEVVPAAECGEERFDADGRIACRILREAFPAIVIEDHDSVVLQEIECKHGVREDVLRFVRTINVHEIERAQRKRPQNLLRCPFELPYLLLRADGANIAVEMFFNRKIPRQVEIHVFLDAECFLSSLEEIDAGET